MNFRIVRIAAVLLCVIGCQSSPKKPELTKKQTPDLAKPETRNGISWSEVRKGSQTDGMRKAKACFQVEHATICVDDYPISAIGIVEGDSLHLTNESRNDFNTLDFNGFRFDPQKSTFTCGTTYPLKRLSQAESNRRLERTKRIFVAPIVARRFVFGRASGGYAVLVRHQFGGNRPLGFRVFTGSLEELVELELSYGDESVTNTSATGQLKNGGAIWRFRDHLLFDPEEEDEKAPLVIDSVNVFWPGDNGARETLLKVKDTERLKVERELDQRTPPLSDDICEIFERSR